MAQPKARLNQRLRTKGFPWVVCEMAKNGSPKPDPDAFQFGIRYTIDGQRKLYTAATLDEAATMLKAAMVRLYASQNGVEIFGRPLNGDRGVTKRKENCRAIPNPPRLLCVQRACSDCILH